MLLNYTRFFRVLWRGAVVLVVVGSLVPEREFEIATANWPDFNDKVLHFSPYFGLALLSMLSFRRGVGVRVALSMTVLGAALEFGQMWSPGRTADVRDALAKALGVLSGIALSHLLRWIGGPARCDFVV